MGGFAAGLAGAIGDHLHEQHLLNLQQQVESKRNLLDNYKTLLSDPHMADVHGDIVGAMLKAAGTDPTKLHKQIGKPGGEFDPTQWQVLAQQRHAGQVPSPVNQGQNPTQIPAAPVQHDSTPGGQSQMAPAWNNASTQSVGPPPGGMSAGDGGDGMGMSIPLPPGVQQPPSQGPAPAEIVGNMGAQSKQALPPTQGSPAPNGVEVTSPQQAAAVAPPPVAAPPPAPIYQGGGSLTQEELNRRSLAFTSQTDEAQQQAEMRRMNQVEGFRRTAERQTRLQQVEDLKADGTWDKLTDRERAAIRSGVSTLGNVPRALPAIHDVPGSSAPPGQQDTFGNDIDPKGVYNIRTNPATGEQDWYPKSDTSIRHTFQWGTDPQNPQKQVLFRIDNAGVKTLVDDISKINPAMIPTQKSTSSSSTTDAAGNTTTKNTSVSQKSLSGAGAGASIPPPPAAKAQGGGGVGGALRSSVVPTAPGASAPKPVSAPPATKFTQQRSDQSYNNAQHELDTIAKPVSDLVTRMTRLQDTLNQNSPQADALVAPELLSVMSGGSGSGLRMNEAEIQRIVGGRSHWEDLKSAVAKWQLDPSKPFLITPEQRGQIRKLVEAVAQRTTAKQDAVNEAYKSLGTETDPAKHRQITTGLRRILSDIEQGKAGTGGNGSGGSGGDNGGAGSGGVTELERGPDGKLRIKGSGK